RSGLTPMSRCSTSRAPSSRGRRAAYWDRLLADGHVGAPKNVDLELPVLPGSKSSARSDMSRAREPGDLGGVGGPMVGRGHGREGRCGNPQQTSKESDAPTVPTCKKSAKTRVTPVEPMEGKGAANGKPAPRNALRAQDRAGALTALERVGQRAKQRKGERFSN